MWEESVDEGERRMDRTIPALLATGFVGGLDVMLGIMALVVLGGGLSAVMPEDTAHALASAAFGIGFVFIVIGRSELFTENFLVPVSTVLHGQRGPGRLVRLWGFTLIGNMVGLFALAAILTRAGLVPPSALDAAAKVSITFGERDFVAALLSGIVAGTVMTLLTWLVHSARDETAKILVALVIGFILAAPSLNHAVVSVGEMALGILADRDGASWTDLAQNFPVAVLGNLIGGLALVTAARLVQVRGEPA